MKSRHIKAGMMKAGMNPGSVIYTGDSNINMPIFIELISYNEYGCDKSSISIADLPGLRSNGKTNWINIIGINDTEMIEKIGEIFSIDSLVLEDITNIGGRPKYDIYKEYSFVLMYMLSYDSQSRVTKHEQFSIILLENCVLTFQEIQGDVFDTLRSRIIESKGKIRANGSPYLFYSIIDSIVDQYFYIINEFEDEIEKLEIEVMEKTEKGHSWQIYDIRRKLLELRNYIWPTRDILFSLVSNEELFSYIEIKHLHDVSDNIKQIIDSISTYREIVMGLYETHLSNVSNKMNRIMTTLTIISVIFIPLTFLAGVYGMNFYYMPELSYKWSYPFFWIACILLSFGMYMFFRRKKWFL